MLAISHNRRADESVSVPSIGQQLLYNEFGQFDRKLSSAVCIETESDGTICIAFANMAARETITIEINLDPQTGVLTVTSELFSETLTRSTGMPCDLLHDRTRLVAQVRGDDVVVCVPVEAQRVMTLMPASRVFGYISPSSSAASSVYSLKDASLAANQIEGGMFSRALDL